MSLLNSLETWYFGVDPAAEQARGDKLDAQLAASNADLLNAGTWSQAQYDAAMADWAKTRTGDVQGQINTAAEEGAVQGLKDLGAGIQSATDFSFGALFKLVPWQAWVIGALALFVWLGGLSLLRGSLAKKA